MKNFQKYFRRPDLMLMRHLQPRSAAGDIRPESIEYMMTAVLPALIQYIGRREIVIFHTEPTRAANTATILQEVLAEHGVTCGAPTSLPRGWEADSGKIQDLAIIHLGATTNTKKLLLLIGHEHTIAAFCHNDEGCGIPGYGEVIAEDCMITGHS